MISWSAPWISRAIYGETLLESGWRLTHFPKDSFTFSQFTVTENPISEAPDV